MDVSWPTLTFDGENCDHGSSPSAWAMARLGQSLNDVEGIILLLPSRRLTDETISTTKQKCSFNQICQPGYGCW